MHVLFTSNTLRRNTTLKAVLAHPLFCEHDAIGLTTRFVSDHAARLVAASRLISTPPVSSLVASHQQQHPHQQHPAADDVGLVADESDGTGQFNSVKSPLQGEVVEVLVQAGQRIGAGEIVVVLSAFKMEYEVRAEKDGSVRVFRQTFCTRGCD
jgi:biotin carboxyl carrier protein